MPSSVLTHNVVTGTYGPKDSRDVPRQVLLSLLPRALQKPMSMLLDDRDLALSQHSSAHIPEKTLVYESAIGFLHFSTKNNAKCFSPFF